MKIKRKIERIVRQGARYSAYCCLFLVLLCASLPTKGQCTAKNDAFQPGEEVIYDLYFNWKFLWKKVGIATLSTNKDVYDEIGRAHV